MRLPTVHLNGTSRDELRRQYSDAYNAVQGALHELRHAAPHWRDYHNQPNPAAYPLAKEEHDDRVTRLQSVSDELYALFQHVNDIEPTSNKEA